MKKVFKSKDRVEVYSYSKRLGLLTERTYYANTTYCVLIRTIFVKPEEVEHAFYIENNVDCIHDLYHWFKDYRYGRRFLKVNPYFSKKGIPKKKWHEL